MTRLRYGRAAFMALLIIGVWGCDDDAPMPFVNADAESSEVVDEPQDASDGETAPSAADASASDIVSDAPVPPKPDVSPIDGGSNSSDTGDEVGDVDDQDVSPAQDVDGLDAAPEDSDVKDATSDEIGRPDGS